MNQSDGEKIAEYLKRAEQADRSAGNADNANIAEQWQLIAGTWRTMADALWALHLLASHSSAIGAA